MSWLKLILLLASWTAATAPAAHASAAWLAQTSAQAPRASQDPATQQAVRLAIDGRYEEASKAFRRLLRRDSQNPLLDYYLGLCYAKMRQYERALSHLRQSVEEEAPFPQAYYWLAETYLRLEEPEKARQAVDDGLAEFPRNEDLLILRSRLSRLPG
ncbi:MAG TPA: CDC27 family protein [Acidobacteriota bacterium]|nr:CDC27 family protein [Acidobacteriota bacterium]